MPVFTAFLALLPLTAGPTLSPPDIRAKAAVLVEVRTGAVLYEKRAYQRRPPASTTKILTALLAVRHPPLDRPLKVSRRAAATPGSRAGIRAGQVYTLQTLLRGLLLRSGNDTAAVLAEELFRGRGGFVRVANRRARSLGALNTHVKNPHGLHARDHFMSARDLALFARALLMDPVLASIVASPTAGFGPLGGPERTIRNTNHLLETFPGATGVKTGTTRQAGKCLVASAERNGIHLVAVLLGSPDRFGEAARLLGWGLSRFRVAEGPPGRRPVGVWKVGAAARPAVPAGVLQGAVPVGARTTVETRLQGYGRLPRGPDRRVGVVSLMGPKGVVATTWAVLRPGGRLPIGLDMGRWTLVCVAWLRSVGVV